MGGQGIEGNHLQELAERFPHVSAAFNPRPDGPKSGTGLQERAIDEGEGDELISGRVAALPKDAH